MLNEGKDLSPLKKTLIVLIPKTQTLKKMEELRPINLCNVVYKLVANTIANKMKKALDSIISPFQLAFVSERLITDNMVVGFECIHAIYNKRKGRSPVSLSLFHLCGRSFSIAKKGRISI